jgi:hypothetical protein
VCSAVTCYLFPGYLFSVVPRESEPKCSAAPLSGSLLAQDFVSELRERNVLVLTLRVAGDAFEVERREQASTMSGNSSSRI